MSDPIKEGKRLAEIFRNGSHKVTTGVGKAVQRGALMVERDAKLNAPVDTGRLRASITHRIIVEGQRIRAQVGTNVKYAKYQEFGTGRAGEAGAAFHSIPEHITFSEHWRGHSAQPFLYPAFRQNKDKIREMIREAVRKELRGL